MSFGGGKGPIYFANLMCTGRESEIKNCKRYNKIGIGEACNHNEDLGVKCY